MIKTAYLSKVFRLHVQVYISLGVHRSVLTSGDLPVYKSFTISLAVTHQNFSDTYTVDFGRAANALVTESV